MKFTALLINFFTENPVKTIKVSLWEISTYNIGYGKTSRNKIKINNLYFLS